MNGLDADTAGLMASAVVLMTSGLYLGTSLVRRDTSGARLWALGYLLTILGVVSFYVWWIGEPGSWGAIVALAMAQGATVGATGCFALGLLAYAPKPIEGRAFAVTALALLCAAASLVDAAAGGSSQQPWTFGAVGVLSLWTAAAAVQGRLRRYPMSWVLALAAAVQGLFSLGRFVTYVSFGGESAAYLNWFGPTPSNILLVTVGLMFSLSIFVLRTTLAGAHGAMVVRHIDEILPFSVFQEQLHALLRRSTQRMETVAVIAARIDALDAITSAFGGDISEEMTRALRSSARRFASPLALVGEGESPTVMYIATLASSQADARRQAGLLYRGIVQDFIDGRDVVLPGIGVGVALSQVLGYDAAHLIEGACTAAVQASANEEASVGFVTVRDLSVDPFPAEPA